MGIHFNSITMEACLTPKRIDSPEKALSHFQKGKLVTAGLITNVLASAYVTNKSSRESLVEVAKYPTLAPPAEVTQTLLFYPLVFVLSERS